MHVSTITYRMNDRIKEARDLDLAVNDHANADGSPAWLFKPLLGKRSNTIIIHCLLTSKGSRMQNNGIYVVVFQMSLPAVKGWSVAARPTHQINAPFFLLSSIFVETLDCWGRALSLIGSMYM